MSAWKQPARFVGRAAELAQLDAALDNARRELTAVFIRSESGGGKSRLLSEFAASAQASGIRVLRGAAIDIGEGAPFWPFRDALQRLAHDEGAASLREAVGPAGSQLAALLPERNVARDAEQVDLSGEQPVLDLLMRTIAALAEHGPLALLLDDMQWSDLSSRRLLTYLLAALTDRSVLLVVAYRVDALDDGGAIHELALELQRQGRATAMRLHPLDRPAVAELCATANRTVVDFVWERSAGNAFIVEELVNSVHADREPAVPDSVRDLVRHRMHVLPPAAQDVARALAIGDEPVTHALLASVLELPEPELLDALYAAVRAGLVSVADGDDGYRIRHGIMREVLADELIPGQRIRLHRRYAEAIESSGERDFRTAAKLAAHWQAAQDWPRAFAAATTAAEDAERSYGFAEADRHWRSALDLQERGSDAERPDLYARAARAAHLAGDADRAAELIRTRLLLEPERPGTARALLHSELGRYLSAAGRGREAVIAHADAKSMLPDDATPEFRVAVLSAYAEALEDFGWYLDSGDQAATALEVAEQAHLDEARARVLPTLGFSVAYLGDPDRGVELMETGVQIATGTGSPDIIGRAHLRLCGLLGGPLNRMGEAIESGRRAAPILDSLGLGRTYGAALQAFIANALFRAGDWAAADAAVAQALAANPTGTASLELRLARCRLLVGVGALARAEDELGLVEILCAQTVGSRYRIPLLTLRAGLEMWRGRSDLAREHVTQGLDEASANTGSVWVLAPLVWHGLRAEADLATISGGQRARREAAVSQLRAQMLELGDLAAAAAAPVRAAVSGYVYLCDAEASRFSGTSDPQTWSLAAQTWTELGHPYPACYARYRLAEALFAHRARAAGALEALASAHAVAARLGAGPMLQEIELLARRAAVVLPTQAEPVAEPVDEPTTPDPLAALTPRERLVLGRLAEGESNRQIARALFISEKTASVHVSHILAKLGVSSRVQAGMFGQRVATANTQEN